MCMYTSLILQYVGILPLLTSRSTIQTTRHGGVDRKTAAHHVPIGHLVIVVEETQEDISGKMGGGRTEHRHALNFLQAHIMLYGKIEKQPVRCCISKMDFAMSERCYYCRYVCKPVIETTFFQLCSVVR